MQTSDTAFISQSVGIRPVGTWRAISLRGAMSLRRAVPRGVVLAAMAILLAACSGTTDSDEYMNTARITGPDYRRCAHPCCGGWFIEIEGTTYRFFELPKGNRLNLNSRNMDDFPIEVKLNWRDYNKPGDWSCVDDVITIDAIEEI